MCCCQAMCTFFVPGPRAVLYAGISDSEELLSVTTRLHFLTACPAASVCALQAHITSHPHRLLPLLQYMISLQKCKLWHEGRQTLLLFKVQLLVGLRQLPERGWPRMMEGLRYQCVLQLLGPKYVDSNNSTPGVNSSSSSSNAPGRQFSRSKGTGSASASSAASLHSSESSGVVGRMTGKELEQLLKQRLPRVQCSFKVRCRSHF